MQPKISSEMQLRYLERRKADLEFLMDALSEQNFEVFARIGHQLKGNASTFGYLDLETIANDLETAGQNSDAVLARQSVLKLHSWIQKQHQE